MRRVPIVAIGDVCSFQNGGTPERNIERYFTGNVPWITGADIVAPFVSEARTFITNEAIRESATNLVPAGTVLLVTRTSVGKVAIAGIDLCFSQDITALTPDASRLYAAYLAAFLRTKAAYFSRHARGATIKGITRQIVADLKIPLPPPVEQRRIAEVLDRGEALRVKRRAALAQLDALTQAIFLNMFGNPVTNPKEWAIKPLGETMCEIYRYPSYYGINYQENGVPEIRGELLQEDGSITTAREHLRFISPATSARFPRTVLAEGDLVMSVRGTIGKIAIVPFALAGANMTANLIRMAPDRSVLDSVFAWYTFQTSYVKAQLVSASSSTTIQTIKAPDLKRVAVPLPPISLQREFARRAAAVEQLKAAQRASLAELDALFASLQHRAFRGEL